MFQENKNYLFERKNVSIHSQDRDITKWPNSNEFEVRLPIQYKKVSSIQLVSIQLPKKTHIISNYNQNTKMNLDICSNPYTIEIDDGYYTPEQMAIAIETKLKEIDSGMNVHYNDINTSFYFSHTNTNASFNIKASNVISYSNICPTNNVHQYTFNWGLPFYLGFDKKIYSSTSGTSHTIIGSDSSTATIPDTSHVIKTPNPSPILGEQDVYLELEHYNSIDEIEPYSVDINNDITDISYLSCVALASLRGERSSNYKHIENNNITLRGKKCLNKTSNDYNGVYNSSFAKIPISIETGTSVLHDNSFFTSYYFSEPPLEKLSKLKFKFRYHDGRLVDFKNYPVSITIQLGILREEHDKKNTYRMSNTFVI